MTRPIQFTNEQMKAALVDKRGLVTLAAEKLGCSYKTVCRRIKRSKQLQDVVRRFRVNRVDRAELALDAAIARGEPWAVSMTLKTLGKGRGYVERFEQEHSGEVTIRYVNDWRNPSADAASGSALREVARAEIQSAQGGTEVAQDNDGHVNGS